MNERKKNLLLNEIQAARKMYGYFKNEVVINYAPDESALSTKLSDIIERSNTSEALETLDSLD